MVAIIGLDACTWVNGFDYSITQNYNAESAYTDKALGLASNKELEFLKRVEINIEEPNEIVQSIPLSVSRTDALTKQLINHFSHSNFPDTLVYELEALTAWETGDKTYYRYQAKLFPDIKRQSILSIIIGNLIDYGDSVKVSPGEPIFINGEVEERSEEGGVIVNHGTFIYKNEIYSIVQEYVWKCTNYKISKSYF